MTQVSATVSASDPAALLAGQQPVTGPAAPDFLLGGIMLHFTCLISSTKHLPAGVALATTAAGSKLLLLIRHGQSVSNMLREKLGSGTYTKVKSKCNYTNSEGNVYNLFDPGG